MLINKVEKKENGFSLVELLAVVGIGGALIAGALLLVNDVNAKKEIKQASENISTVYSNMVNLFSDEPVDSTMKSLVIAGVFPSTLNINSTKTVVKNSGGGVLSITTGSGDNGFNLLYPAVKSGACVEIIKNQKRVGWDSWSVKSGKSSNAKGDNEFSDISKSSVGKIATACETTDDWVSLTFTVGS